FWASRSFPNYNSNEVADCGERGRWIEKDGVPRGIEESDRSLFHLYGPINVYASEVAVLRSQRKSIALDFSFIFSRLQFEFEIEKSMGFEGKLRSFVNC
uniref:Uncharacterized protein n=1 Tax=Cucumis melo TaxID=3656 RepID=A0A9I9DXK5_CUCME